MPESTHINSEHYQTQILKKNHISINASINLLFFMEEIEKNKRKMYFNCFLSDHYLNIFLS
jgi:hypothetical protein